MAIVNAAMPRFGSSLVGLLIELIELAVVGGGTAMVTVLAKRVEVGVGLTTICVDIGVSNPVGAGVNDG